MSARTEKGGVDPLLDKLDAEVDASELERLGLLVDANDDMNTRWQSIRDRLYSLGYTDAPTQANLDGMFVEEQEIRPDRLVELARGAVQHILEGLRKDSLNHEIKAVVHIGLAWQEEPGKPMGQAIQKGYIDLNHANLNLFMNWLNKTFALGVR